MTAESCQVSCVEVGGSGAFLWGGKDPLGWVPEAASTQFLPVIFAFPEGVALGVVLCLHVHPVCIPSIGLWPPWASQ